MPGPSFQITEDGPGILLLAGELDVATSSSLDQEIEKALRTCPDIVLDFSRVTFIDSTGVALLVRTNKDRRCRTIVVRGLNGGPRKVIHLTGLVDIPGILVELSDDPSVQ
jgi:anti-anti-sigma factor